MRLGQTLTMLAGFLLQPTLVCAYSPVEGNVSASFGAFIHRTNFNLPPPGLTSSFRTNFGIVLNGDLNDRGQLEIAIYHLFKQYFRDIGSSFVAEETELVDIAVGYRHWLTNSFSVGLALSSSYSMGQPNLFHNDFGSDRSVDTSARDTTEYALTLSPQLDLFSFRRFTGIVSGLYSLSLTGKPGERADHYGAMIGFRYFIQEKQIVERPKDSIPAQSP